jgi:hypothetical protein
MSTTVKAESNESFNYVGAGWWKSSGYDSQRVKGRVVSGNFDGVGGADIGMIYDYSNSVTRIHMLLSNVESSLNGQYIVNYAKQFLGVPYVWGGTTPDGFDCSGFTSYVYRHTTGIEIGRTTWNQMDRNSHAVGYLDLQVGDLVFTYGRYICWKWKLYKRSRVWRCC